MPLRGHTRPAGRCRTKKDVLVVWLAIWLARARADAPGIGVGGVFPLGRAGEAAATTTAGPEPSADSAPPIPPWREHEVTAPWYDGLDDEGRAQTFCALFSYM